MQIIDGKALSSKIRADIKAQVAELKSKGVEACLAVILVGNDPSSELYVKNKVKASEEVGIKSILCRFPLTVSEKELIDEIERLNADDTVSGILVCGKSVHVLVHVDMRGHLFLVDRIG